jgi:hypothetical protein
LFDVAGEEESVNECVHEPWGEGNCRHDEDVAVECFVDDTPPVVAGSDVSLKYNTCIPNRIRSSILLNQLNFIKI